MHKCRICFRSKPRKDLCDIIIIENGEKRGYKDVILFCLGIQISDESKTNTKSCVSCYRKIIEFYNFKVLAIKNDDFMRFSVIRPLALEIINNAVLCNVDVKTENVSDENIPDNEDMFDEPLIELKTEDNTNDTVEFKFELNSYQSDNELLNVINHLKSEAVEDNNESVPIPAKRKRVKVKNINKLTQEELKEKKRRAKGVISGICEECGKEFRDLRMHRKTHLSIENRPKVKCDHCDKVFFSNINKRKHIQRRHLSSKQKCHLCEKTVVDLKLHMRGMHNQESLQFECVHCHRKFLTQARLNVHVTIHTKDRPYKCEICGNCFRLKLSLTNHIRQVHEKERSHLCQFCSKSFFKRHHLQIHLRTHTNEKPYECPDCGKFYQTATSLKTHRLRHSNERNVKCTLCDATFITKSDRNIHMKSHLKTKRYPCSYCEAKFHRSDHRNRHENTAHLKKYPGDVTEKRKKATVAKINTIAANIATIAANFANIAAKNATIADNIANIADNNATTAANIATESDYMTGENLAGIGTQIVNDKAQI